LKLEGARTMGYRSMFFGGFCDPILIRQLDVFLKGVQQYVKGKMTADFTLRFHQYGKNAIMESLKTQPSTPTEIGLCGEVVASSQALATQACNLARIACIHGPYPHQLATAGNFAMPFPPFDIPMGQVCEFCVYHLLKDVHPTDRFPIASCTVEGEGTFKLAGTSPAKEPSRVRDTREALERMSTKHTTRSTFLKPDPPSGHCYLGEVASVIRTKNAGPYELTIDVMFDNPDTFNKAKMSGVLSPRTIMDIYQISDEDLIACLFWDPAMSFKATIRRPVVSGSVGDLDIHGSQQHVPLMFVQLPFSSM
jgi:hypothetical protein